ncbi:MAG: 23S rRNA (adenine(2503)-C(2))-methyltransferase RlmN [Eubacteriales bacterium]|nr:23S rRNA (adenine(2503)-C(2))-methyltransferase RlmN [Eubacteriales bacterium]
MTKTVGRVSLYDYDRTDWQAFCQARGLPKYRGTQIHEALMRGANQSSLMQNIPNTLKAEIDAAFPKSALSIRKLQVSSIDGSRKYLFQLRDGAMVEAVLMHYHHGASICLSTQVGCCMGCYFCASSQLGFERNLSAGEMLEQFVLVSKEAGLRIHNMVLMGIGEPLDNLDEVLRFVDLVSDPKGVNLGARRITISTSGLIPGIDRLAALRPQFTLSISLHAAEQAKRAEIMPIANRYPLDELMAACKRYLKAGGKRISFEYILLRDFNDRDEDAEALAQLVKPLLCHVNLIPSNEVPGSRYHASRKSQIRRFQSIVESHGIPCTLRRSLGRDIEAACGQLRRSEKEKHSCGDIC